MIFVVKATIVIIVVIDHGDDSSMGVCYNGGGGVAGDRYWDQGMFRGYVSVYVSGFRICFAAS